MRLCRTAYLLVRSRLLARQHAVSTLRDSWRGQRLLLRPRGLQWLVLWLGEDRRLQSLAVRVHSLRVMRAILETRT